MMPRFFLEPVGGKKWGPNQNQFPPYITTLTIAHTSSLSLAFHLSLLLTTPSLPFSFGCSYSLFRGTPWNVSDSTPSEESQSSKAIIFRKPSPVVVLMPVYPHGPEGAPEYTVHSRNGVGSGAERWTAIAAPVHLLL